MNVFISYRRDDSILAARVLHGELSKRYGDANVFMDIEDIGYGDNFITAIDARLDDADVVVVVIGPRWQEMIEQRIRGDDWVRHEVARALKLRGESLAAAAAGSDSDERPRIIPVLVAKAPPLQGPLPEDLKALQPLAAMALDERALRPSINSLIEAINQKSFESRVGDEIHEKRARSWRLVLGGLIGLAVFFAGWVKLFDFFGLDTRVASATMWLADLVPVPPRRRRAGGGLRPRPRRAQQRGCRRVARAGPARDAGDDAGRLRRSGHERQRARPSAAVRATGALRRGLRRAQARSGAIAAACRATPGDARRAGDGIGARALRRSSIARPRCVQRRRPRRAARRSRADGAGSRSARAALAGGELLRGGNGALGAPRLRGGHQGRSRGQPAVRPVRAARIARGAAAARL